MIVRELKSSIRHSLSAEEMLISVGETFYPIKSVLQSKTENGVVVALVAGDESIPVGESVFSKLDPED